MAAYPTEYTDEPQVYGVYTDESMKAPLEAIGVKIVQEEGVVNGLNGVVIGIAKSRGIPGVCLMGDIKYANVPQHLSSRAVLIKLAPCSISNSTRRSSRRGRGASTHPSERGSRPSRRRLSSPDLGEEARLHQLTIRRNMPEQP